jgi:hypothetical protein
MWQLPGQPSDFAWLSRPAQKTQPLDTIAQRAAILDQVVSLALRVDFLKFHRMVAVYARHEIHQRTLIIVQDHRSRLLAPNALELLCALLHRHEFPGLLVALGPGIAHQLVLELRTFLHRALAGVVPNPAYLLP